MFQVINSETGRILEIYELPLNTAIYNLKRVIEVKTNIKVQKVILLTSNGRLLNDKHVLANYVNEKRVFLFDKGNLGASTSSSLINDRESESEFLEYNLRDVTLDVDHEKTLKVEELLQDNVVFVKGFYFHTVQAEKILSTSTSRGEYCVSKRTELINQYDSLRSAYMNLAEHGRVEIKRFNWFKLKFEKQAQIWKETVLDTFDQDLSFLKEIPVHPKLLEEDSKKKTLFDCIPLKQLTAWKEKCEVEFGKFRMLLEKAETGLVAGVKAGVAREEVTIELFDFEKVKEHQNEMKRLLERQRGIKKLLTEEYVTYLPVLKPMKEITPEVSRLVSKRETLLGEMRTNDEGLFKLSKVFSETKGAFTELMFERLGRISQMQRRIKKLRNKYSVFRTIFENLKEKFLQVELIGLFPGAYSLTLLEIARRHQFMRGYKDEVLKARERINSLRVREMERRRRFETRVANACPKFLQRDLKAPPPTFQVSLIKKIDPNVPEMPRIEFVAKDQIFKDHLRRLIEKDGKSDYRAVLKKNYARFMDLEEDNEKKN